MTKALAILGIIGVALAALLSFAVSGEFVPVLVLLFLWASGIFLLVRRSTLTTIVGIVSVVLGVSALLYYNPVTGAEGQEYLPALPDYFRGAFMPTLVVLGVVGLLLGARQDIEPMWTGYVGFAGALLAIVLVAFLPVDQFGNFANPLGIGVAVLVLTLLVPLVALLVTPPLAVPPATRAPTVTRPGTIRRQ